MPSALVRAVLTVVQVLPLRAWNLTEAFGYGTWVRNVGEKRFAFAFKLT
jgi:hypothetical protein